MRTTPDTSCISREAGIKTCPVMLEISMCAFCQNILGPFASPKEGGNPDGGSTGASEERAGSRVDRAQCAAMSVGAARPGRGGAAPAPRSAPACEEGGAGGERFTWRPVSRPRVSSLGVMC